MPVDFTFAMAQRERFTFSAGAEAAGRRFAAQDARQIFHGLISDQEGEENWYAAKLVVDARLAAYRGARAGLPERVIKNGAVDRDEIIGFLEMESQSLNAILAEAMASAPGAALAMLRERAAIALIAGCWLDTVSQPATQPGYTVNALFAQHFVWLGEGVPAQATPQLRRRWLDARQIILPDVLHPEFGEAAGICQATALAASFYVAMSRFPAQYFPELVGLHCAFHALGVDALLGMPPPLASSQLSDVLTAYLEECAAHSHRAMLQERLLAGVAAVLDLERANVTVLCARARLHVTQSAAAQVAALVRKHAPMAGVQHRNVRVGGAPMAEIFARPDYDLAAFLRALKTSHYFRFDKKGECPFSKALKLGGPMFGIFTAAEAELFASWARAPDGQIDVPAAPLESGMAEADLASLRGYQPDDVDISDTAPADDRQFLFQLVNIEAFPNTLTFAKARALEGLAAGRALFGRHDGKYTDTSFFEYSPAALTERIERIYWERLINPYRPLPVIPDRDEVVFMQRTFALGNLIDGSWSYKIGNTGRFTLASDGGLFRIHADEMGLGDVRKNHITLIHRVLRSLDIQLPHISSPDFLDQAELPDDMFGFAINQLCLALFPDSFYPEIIGYNLGIEMFGLGELRLHEIQKLRYHKFDTIYEQAHLSIDNISSGHARQSARIIIDYLEYVRARFGAAAVAALWPRIWSGYCSFARFVETGHTAGEAASGQGLHMEDVLDIMAI